MKRRRRRSTRAIVAERALIDIKQRKRAFLKEVSAILTETLGFTVRVSLVAPNRMDGLSLDQRRAARMTKKVARRQMREAFAPFFEEEPE